MTRLQLLRRCAGFETSIGSSLSGDAILRALPARAPRSVDSIVIASHSTTRSFSRLASQKGISSFALACRNAVKPRAALTRAA